MEDRIKSAIEKIRPILKRDGGDIELVAVEGNVVKVRLQGACRGCPMSQMTIKGVVEKALRDEVPDIEKVEVV